MSDKELYYLEMDTLPAISINVWLKHAPVLLADLRGEDYNPKEAFKAWRDIDINPQLGIRVLAEENEQAEELFRLPPRNWVNPHPSDTLTSRLQTANMDALSLGMVGHKALGHIIDTIETDQPLPEPIKAKWREVREITRRHLNVSSTPIDDEQPEEGDGAW